jgi:tetratricopeptide (TPR) repeat protein
MVNTNLSLYYMKLGDKETAEDQSALAAQKSMRKGRKGVDASALIQAQIDARRADATRKKGMFEQVLDFDPDDPIALFGIGSALGVLGQWAEALPYLVRASEVNRRNSAVYVAWGKTLEALERLADAQDVYKMGIDVASRRGDLMPLKEMEHRVLLLKATTGSID